MQLIICKSSQIWRGWRTIIKSSWDRGAFKFSSKPQISLCAICWMKFFINKLYYVHRREQDVIRISQILIKSTIYHEMPVSFQTRAVFSTVFVVAHNSEEEWAFLINWPTVLSHCTLQYEDFYLLLRSTLILLMRRLKSWKIDQ